MLVQAYLAHLSKTVNGVSADHFDPAINIFVGLQSTVPVQAMDPEIDPVTELMSLRGLVQRLETLRQKMKEKKKERRYQPFFSDS